MKAEIHPKYIESSEIKCSCGHVTIAGSTRENLKTELCSKCHPFYTGQTKLVDTAGRVDKFHAKRKLAQDKQDEVKKRAEAKTKKPEAYVEKEVPAEVLARAMGAEQSGKWGKPLGETLTEEVAKEDAIMLAETEKPKKEKKPAAKKTSKK